ncbi:MAG: hypothetical protein QM642_05490 [Edaphocola sp.]
MQATLFPISPIKRLISYLVPVTIMRKKGTCHPYLEFIYYRGQWQLATEDALYSDGYRYAPFRLAFKKIPKQRLAALNSCLVLGAGLGSIVQILSHKYKTKARFDLVEKDDKVLGWAMELLAHGMANEVRPFCADAHEFVQESGGRKYELICIDIFIGREVPAIFTETAFLRQTGDMLHPGGYWIMNYIENDAREAEKFLAAARQVFPTVSVLTKERNKILIARV